MTDQLKRRAKDALKSISNLHFQGSRRNIIVNATPRGGSTWLMEILASQRRMKYYDEPFNIRRANIQKIGLFRSWDDLMPDSADKQKVLRFLDDLTRNKHRLLNPPPLRRHYSPVSTRIVFKLHELEFLIEEIAEYLKCDVVYLIRHPIPNSLSRNVVPRLPFFLTSEYYRERYLDENSHKAIKRIVEIGSDLQQFVVSWCFENIDALQNIDRLPWTVISYEELVLNPIRSCRLLAENLSLPQPQRLFRQTGEPSFNIDLSSSETLDLMDRPDSLERKIDIVTRWKKKVTREEQEDVFEILQIFGISAYSNSSLLPARRLLNFESTERLLG